MGTGPMVTIIRGTLAAAFKGSSYGSGSGSGDGYGYGDGSGSGYGSDGDGDGSGYGSGDGYGSYWLACLEYFIDKLPASFAERARTLQAKGVKLAYWRSTADGRPANGGSAPPVSPGTVHKEKGPLNLCQPGTLHATLIPPEWKGERWWVVALVGEVVGDDEKYGALEREIIGECV